MAESYPPIRPWTLTEVNSDGGNNRRFQAGGAGIGDAG